MSKVAVFNINIYLSDAETDYLIDGRDSFVFELRRLPNVKDYYQRLEFELRSFPEIKVVGFRTVKEGFTNISRPAFISFDAEYLTTARPHLKLMRKQIIQIDLKYKDFLSVSNFIRTFLKDSLQNLDILDSCLDIFKYLISNRTLVKGFLPRHIPHGQSTKLIGKEPLLLKVFLFYLRLNGKAFDSVSWRDFFSYFELERVKTEFRFFAPHCKIQDFPIVNFNGIFDHDSLSQFNFSELSSALIVENYSSFYALTQFSKNTLLIWGGGFKAVTLISLLRLFPSPIFYWGDIDKEGYEIYGLLKAEFKSLQAIMMDSEILNKYRHLIQKKQIFDGPFKNLFELQNTYETVATHGIQIEQEQIEIHWPLQIKEMILS
jgi:hypothetical protein